MPFQMPQCLNPIASHKQSLVPSSRPIALSRLLVASAATLLVLSAASSASAGAAVPRTPSNGSDWGDSSTTSTRSGSNPSNGEIRGYDYEGFYGQFALSIGRIDFDGGVDSEASGGFGLTAGYRALPWLSGEAHFQFLGGQDNAEFGNVDRDSQFFAFTFGPKVYPLGLIEIEEIPNTIQPYAFIGIGGGEGKIDGGDEESSFVARFILGIDLWTTDNLGFFIEGGGFAAEDDDIDGAGVFSIGAQYRF